MAERAQMAQPTSRTPDGEPTAADLLDPVALERRLVEARARRAEALARKGKSDPERRGVATVAPVRAPAAPTPAAAPKPKPRAPQRPLPAATRVVPVGRAEPKTGAGIGRPLLLALMFGSGLAGATAAALFAPPALRERLVEAITPGSDDPAEDGRVAAPAEPESAPPTAPAPEVDTTAAPEVGTTAAPETEAAEAPEIDGTTLAALEPPSVERAPAEAAAPGPDAPDLLPASAGATVALGDGRSAALTAAIPLPAEAQVASLAAAPVGTATPPTAPTSGDTDAILPTLPPLRVGGAEAASEALVAAIPVPQAGAAAQPAAPDVGSAPVAAATVETAPALAGSIEGATPTPDDAGPRLAALTSVPAPFAAEEPASLPGSLPGARVLIHYPPNAAGAAEAAVGALRDAGADSVSAAPVQFTVSRTNIRYYHAADASNAQGARDLLAAGLGDDAVQARDFTHFRPQPGAGYLEVWVAGDAPAARAAVDPPAAAPRVAAPRAAAPIRQLRSAVSRPSAVRNADPAQLERAVEQMLLRQLQGR